MVTASNLTVRDAYDLPDADAIRAMGFVIKLEDAQGEAERHAERLATQIEDRRKALEEAEADLAALFEVAGATDEASFVTAIARADRRRELEAEAKAMADRIHARIGTDEYAGRLKARLETGEKARWEAELVAIGVERDALAGDHREAQRALADLEASSDVPRSELELAAIIRRVQDAAHRYRIVSYAHRLIADTLKRFERERQPEVLLRASEHLHALTGGVYARLSMESDRQLVITDSRDVEHDPVSFSVETRQIFVFTCHPATADLLQGAIPDARRIDLPRYAGAPGPVGGFTVRTARVAAASRPAGDSASPEAADRVVAHLKEAAASQLKVEIVTGTGLPDAVVTRTLGQLREDGAVETEGRGQGTRYRLAGA